MESHRKDDTPPSSREPDGQPGNPSGPHHPSDERRRNRDAEAIPVTHHADEPHDPAATAREHRERLEHHERRK